MFQYTKSSLGYFIIKEKYLSQIDIKVTTNNDYKNNKESWQFMKDY